MPRAARRAACAAGALAIGFYGARDARRDDGARVATREGDEGAKNRRARVD